MIIKKEYKMYCGHRNQELADKCFRPHGHHYLIAIFFNVKRTGSISTLFSDFDSKIEPMLKEEYDHRFLMDKNDPLLPYMQAYEKEQSEDLGLKILERPSSVENMAYELMKECVERFGFSVDRIELKETMSSTVVYTHADYLSDKDYFNE